jgi:hypothetical protein
VAANASNLFMKRAVGLRAADNGSPPGSNQMEKEKVQRGSAKVSLPGWDWNLQQVFV